MLILTTDYMQIIYPFAESNELRSSTGVALNWMSPLGPMSFVLSQNISKADTDKAETFRFNLGTTF